jgi:hypothetical protein
VSDDELLSLKRRHEAEPGDAGLEREYERALERAGRIDELAARIEPRLRCPVPWAELRPTDPQAFQTRPCPRCNRAAWFVRDACDVLTVTPGAPVAGTADALRAVARAMASGPMSAPPCFAVADAPSERGPWCLCLAEQEVRDHPPTRFHDAVQDETCEGWKALLDLIEQAARDGRPDLEPMGELGLERWREVITLPPTIAKLKQVKSLLLYGSHLVRLPPEIGEMTSLVELDPYTSYRLHWLPYEVTRCPALRSSRFSTRALYGNYKFRPPFPDLDVERGPETSTCSVCARPIETSIQAWISLRVAKDVLPLLVNACSHACIARLPEPAEGYVPRPHRGGRTHRTPRRS